MVQVDGKWDYECFCKSGHVSYSTKQSENILAALGLDGVGGYREPCEKFKCNFEGDQVNQGHHTNEDDRYKVFVPSNDPNDSQNAPLAWEAAKQMVTIALNLTNPKHIVYFKILYANLLTLKSSNLYPNLTDSTETYTYPT